MAGVKFLWSRRLRCVLFLLLAASVRATTVIYPVSAIDDFWVMPADEFRQKYGGINITGLGPSDEGWYVRYRHENLTCLFGPLADREEARKKKWDLEAVRDAAIRNRTSLASSQVDYVRFSFSGVYGRGGDGTGGLGEMARVSADGKSGPDGDLDGDGIPNSQDNDMDGDGIPNDRDDDMDGDGIPNQEDDYMYGRNPNAPSGNGRDGPEGDLDGDGIANAADGDMDGDGIPNAQDPDIDGDGIRNAQDKYPYGRDDGPDGNSGSGRPAGGGGQQGDGRTAGQQGGQKGGSRQDGQGSEGGEAGSQGQQISSGQQAGQRQTASNQRGSQSGQQMGQMGQQGSQQSSGQQSSASSSQSSSQGGSPGGPPSGSSGGGGNPLNIITALMRLILGL